MKISIITPNYNYSRFIGKTVQSVIDQKFPDWEHIIVDDGSTDNSVEIINHYADQYPGKIILVKQQNRGQTNAINRALKLVTGDIIGWINSDDYYCENIFWDLESFFEKNPKTDIITGNVNIVDISGNYIYTKRHLKFSYTESAFLGFGNTLTSNCTFWRKSLSDLAGSFDEGLKCNMDGEYFSRLTYKANLHFLDKPVANFRKQEITITAKVNENWDQIVKNEINYEKIRSYKNLGFSKIIPFEIGKHLAICFLVLRFARKMLRFDYWRIRSEKRAYFRSLQKMIL
jgi:glycosyltransferase involved in cell wall biosynthesis